MSMRDRVAADLARRGISVPTHLPLTAVRKLRSVDEIAQRIVQLYAMAGLALPESDASKVHGWLAQLGALDSLPDAEESLLRRGLRGDLTPKERIDLSWLRESMCVLSWAVRLLPELPFPNKETPVLPVLKRIPPQVGLAELKSASRVLDEDDIHYELDRHYCVHWYLRECRESSAARKTAKPDVVVERRRALEWLASGEAWYEAPLDT